MDEQIPIDTKFLYKDKNLSVFYAKNGYLTYVNVSYC